MSAQHRPVVPLVPSAAPHAAGVLVFDVDLPPREASPNGAHGSWANAARVRRVYRELVGWQARAARPANWVTPQMARVSLVFGTARCKGDGLYRPLDIPNAISAFKGGFDGIVDAGLVLDDRWRNMKLGATEIDPGSGPGVRVTIEALG